MILYRLLYNRPPVGDVIYSRIIIFWSMTMQPRLYAKLGLVFLTAIGLLAVSACGSRDPEPLPSAVGPAAKLTGTVPFLEPLRDEIPPAELSAVMAAHFRGLGYMEQYEYAKAVESFREVHRRAPGWIPGAINLAIALLNDTGTKVEEAKGAGGGSPLGNFDEALDLLARVLDRDAGNPYAHFCRGIILEQQGRMLEAHRHFERVTEIDPSDAAAWYWFASTTTEAGNEVQFDAPKQAKEQIAPLARALDCNPYLVPALYKLQQAYRLTNDPKKASELLARFQRLKQDRSDPRQGLAMYWRKGMATWEHTPR